MIDKLSEKHEEILEAVWKAAETNSCSMEAIRKKCVVTFTNGDIDFLEQNQFIVKSGDRVLFSEAGNKVAENLVRRHRLAEVLLISALALKRSEMERIACEVEHSLHPEVEEAICVLLGHPEYCPDGKPIPKGMCCTKGHLSIDNRVMCLDELDPGERGKVTYIKPDSIINIEQLISFGVSPGTVVEIKQKSPAYCIGFGNTELALDNDVIRSIFVWKLAS